MATEGEWILKAVSWADDGWEKNSDPNDLLLKRKTIGYISISELKLKTSDKTLCIEIFKSDVQSTIFLSDLNYT